jgi:predicted GNAT superfamily acetyltransferase
MGMTHNTQTDNVQSSAQDGMTIRALKGVEDCRNFQQVTGTIWGGDTADEIPLHVLITIGKNGGIIMGAFAEDGPAETGGMVGITLGWLGTGVDPATPGAPPKLKFCSHMAGVLPAWQGKHVGLRLKLAQRDAVLAQGLTDWITWTYDPLYRPNGVLNIHRLGATCTTYIQNLYGVMNDDLNRGVPSDRCQVDWRISSPHVVQKVQPPADTHSPHPDWEPDILEILPSSTDAAGFATPGEAEFEGKGRPLAVPIPGDISAIRRRDQELSLAWRIYLRTVLEAAFATGYTMVDCVHLPDHGWHYILVREYL